MSEYIRVPVEAAKDIALKFQKNSVIICSWDAKHELLHTTTYGVTPEDKVNAADGGETCASALGMDLARGQWFEDFRVYDAAKAKVLREAAQKYLPELKRMAAQVISPKDNYFARMVRDLEAGL